MLAVCLVLGVACGTAAASSVNYGDISHKNLKDLGQASTGTKLPLEVGLIANQSGIASAVKSASNSDLVELRKVSVDLEPAEQVRRVVLAT